MLHPLEIGSSRVGAYSDQSHLASGLRPTSLVNVGAPIIYRHSFQFAQMAQFITANGVVNPTLIGRPTALTATEAANIGQILADTFGDSRTVIAALDVNTGAVSYYRPTVAYARFSLSGGQGDHIPNDLAPGVVQDLQQRTTDWLDAHGYVGIGIDDNLGNETCGAIAYVSAQSDRPFVYYLPSACPSSSGWKPTKKASGGGGGGGTTTTCPTGQTLVNGVCTKPATAVTSSGSGGLIAALVGGAIGLGVLVAAGQSKKKRKARK